MYCFICKYVQAVAQAAAPLRALSSQLLEEGGAAAALGALLEMEEARGWGALLGTWGVLMQLADTLEEGPWDRLPRSQP